ncbi:MAG TPA: hypothetical protein VMU05_14865 [Dongiaceae bacterium]|nr:hypothetical protein [Dongiaceae bacterium]
MPRPSNNDDAYSQRELDELRNNLARLSPPSVTDFYRDAYRECAPERKPGPRAVQRLITAWKILTRWQWR